MGSGLIHKQPINIMDLSIRVTERGVVLKRKDRFIYIPFKKGFKPLDMRITEGSVPMSTKRFDKISPEIGNLKEKVTAKKLVVIGKGESFVLHILPFKGRIVLANGYDWYDGDKWGYDLVII